MKLLIITQVIDTEHPILGFFHRWVEEFAVHCESVQVICLEAGKHSLPANVTVHSLGKETGSGKLLRTWRFYKLVWMLRHEYDSIFVHMNQIYVLLGGLFWRLQKKKIGLWYMHGTVSFSLRVAEKMVDYIFSGSKESFRLPSKKLHVTGHGIDTNHFVYNQQEKDLDIITVGRIGESKNLFAQIDILQALHEEGVSTTLAIIGAGVTAAEKQHEQALRAYIKKHALQQQVRLMGRVNQTDLPSVLGRAKVFLTTAQNGSLDKAILEAMAMGLPVVSMAPGAASLPLGSAQVENKTQCIALIKRVLESRNFYQPEHVEYIAANHSIQSLVPKILAEYSHGLHKASR